MLQRHPRSKGALMLASRLSRTAVLLTALACRDSTDVAQDEFSIHATGEEVVLTNATEKPTYYFIVERQTAAVLDFATCVEGPRCKSVAPGSTARIPYRQIAGYKADRKEA